MCIFVVPSSMASHSHKTGWLSPNASASDGQQNGLREEDSYHRRWSRWGDCCRCFCTGESVRHHSSFRAKREGRRLLVSIKVPTQLSNPDIDLLGLGFRIKTHPLSSLTSRALPTALQTNHFRSQRLYPRILLRSTQNRYAETSVYPSLEANIDASVMEFSQEPIPNVKSQASIRIHGPDTPFRHHTVIHKYIEDLLNRNCYHDWVEYNRRKRPKSSKLPTNGN